jgi:GDP/UDP-N,N'-diacetylbacillosamine 2-epimerase (hydrolysing)
MSRAIGQEIIGITAALEQEQPDMVIVLGDRGEMLAGALAAIHLNIPVIHIHGGERTGTVDEPVRHAISKLAHYHFVTTPGAKERLIKMGEQGDNVFITGAPGLDGICASAVYDRDELCKRDDLDSGREIALLVFHPVVQDSKIAHIQMKELMESVLSCNLQIIALLPNSDSGGSNIAKELDKYSQHQDVRIRTHLGRNGYISWMAAADVLIGNSSSGIIEAATLGIPVVNVGDRQYGRERNANVVDVDLSRESIISAVATALSLGRKEWDNVYGSGNAGEKIVSLTKSLPLDDTLLKKTNAY